MVYFSKKKLYCSNKIQMVTKICFPPLLKYFIHSYFFLYFNG